MRFFKRKPATVMLTDESLDRAIRAGVAFPLDWFLAQTEDVQEVIAARRDRWLEDLTVAAGYAVLDPEATRLALEAEDGGDDAEAAIVEMNARAMAERMGRSVAAKQSPGALSMAGVGNRRREFEERREAGRRKPDLSDFGAAPGVST
jgi:hypothetical protein